MIHQTESEPPQPVAEAESLVGVASTDLFSPFEGSDDYFILCVKDGKIVREIDQDEDDYTKYHIENLGGDEWRIERADAAELCESVYQGRIPDRAFFVTLMNNQSAPLPESWENEKVHSSPLTGVGGSATPDAPGREWACNRCMYSWDGNSGWCPSCGEQATHGRAFAAKKDNLMEKLRIIQSGKTAIMPTGEIVERSTAGSMDYDSLNGQAHL